MAVTVDLCLANAYLKIKNSYSSQMKTAKTYSRVSFGIVLPKLFG